MIPFFLRLFYVMVLLAVSYADLRQRRIPNRIIAPAILIALGDALWRADALNAGISGLVAVGFFAVPLFVGLPGIGLGDLKLAFFIGLILGWPAVMGAVKLSVLPGALAALSVLVLRRGDRKTTIPYGPFLALGTIAAWIFQVIQ